MSQTMRQNVTPGFRNDLDNVREGEDVLDSFSERHGAPVREQSLRLSLDFRAGKG